jgi:O-methyltransferase involved in polyketide biosynthesis
MMEKVRFDIKNNVAETLLIPLFSRANEYGRSDALMVDETAVRLVESIDYDFSQIKLEAHDYASIILRMREFDHIVSNFLKQNPKATVVHIGCGLDTRFERLNNSQVEWYDLDIPEVIDLRHQLGFIKKGNYHTINSSVFDFAWLDQLAPCRANPMLFIAEGVFLYFYESQVKALILNLQERFPGSEMAFDAMTPLMMACNNLQMAFYKFKARLHWGLRNPKDMETWAEGIRLLSKWYYFDRSEPRLGSIQFMRHIPVIAKGQGIFHYKLGENS